MNKERREYVFMSWQLSEPIKKDELISRSEVVLLFHQTYTHLYNGHLEAASQGARIKGDIEKITIRYDPPLLDVEEVPKGTRVIFLSRLSRDHTINKAVRRSAPDPYFGLKKLL
jgi:hypothetical protein